MPGPITVQNEIKITNADMKCLEEHGYCWVYWEKAKKEPLEQAVVKTPEGATKSVRLAEKVSLFRQSACSLKYALCV